MKSVRQSPDKSGPVYDFLWSITTLSGIISTKTSKSPDRILTNTNNERLIQIYKL